MTIGDVKWPKVVGEEVDRKPLIPRGGNRLLHDSRLVTRFGQNDFPRSIVSKIGRDGTQTFAFAIDFHQSPRWISPDRQTAIHAAGQVRGDYNQSQDDMEILHNRSIGYQ